jgi:hypothetical protein
LNDLRPDFAAIALDQSAEALAVAHNSPIRALTLDYMDMGWEWLPPRLEKIAKISQECRAFWWQGRQGLLLIDIETGGEMPEPRPYLVYLACAAEMLVDLLTDYRRLAGQLGYANAGWSPPMHTGLEPYLTSAGFERKWDGAVFLFEKTMRM